MTEKCKFCGHDLTNNQHGPDQNDFYGENSTGLGTCSYCFECNPKLKKFLHLDETSIVQSQRKELAREKGYDS